MTRRLVLNLAVFFTVSALVIGYGVVNLFGTPFRDPVVLVTRMPETAGLRPGFSVTLDGVVVGTVGDVELAGDGVDIEMELDDGVEVPGDVEARIVRASAIGEQRVDLTPTAGGTAAPLPDGARVPAAADAVPPNVEEVITTVRGLLEALPTEDLNTVIRESATALEGRAGDLRAIVRSTEVITTELLRRDGDLRQLLAAAPDVLDDLSDSGADIRRAVANTRAVTQILADRRTDLVDLVRGGADLAEVATPLLRDTRADLDCLLGSLATLTSGLQGRPLADLDAALGLSTSFFEAVGNVAVEGPTKDLGYGGGARSDQTWLRGRVLLPPPGPPAVAYDPNRGTPTTRLGAACASSFAGGAAAPTQADPAPVEAGGRVVDARGRPVADGEQAAGADPARGEERARSTANPPLIPIVALGVGGLVLLGTVGPLARRSRRTPR